jgi:hypothetical protein
MPGAIVYYPAFSTYNSDISIETNSKQPVFPCFLLHNHFYLFCAVHTFEIRDLKYDEVTLHTQCNL